MARLVRYHDGVSPRWGVLDVDDLTVRRVEGSIYGDWQAADVIGKTENIELLPPCEPTTVVALAYNYKDLVGDREIYDEPLVFIKSPTCVIGGNTSIKRPSWATKVWVEVEVAFVVRHHAFQVSHEQAERSILGFTIANDVTAENIHGRDHHLARSKSVDTFCPVGPVLHTDVDTSRLHLTTRINGRVTQRGTTANRILNDVQSLMLASRFIRLQPGDLILTGTPAGAMDSLVLPGDDAQLEIEALGRLNNPIETRE